jgi:hypothetical protein
MSIKQETATSLTEVHKKQREFAKNVIVKECYSNLVLRGKQNHVFDGRGLVHDKAFLEWLSVETPYLCEYRNGYYPPHNDMSNWYFSCSLKPL